MRWISPTKSFGAATPAVCAISERSAAARSLQREPRSEPRELGEHLGGLRQARASVSRYMATIRILESWISPARNRSSRSEALSASGGRRAPARLPRVRDRAEQTADGVEQIKAVVVRFQRLRPGRRRRHRQLPKIWGRSGVGTARRNRAAGPDCCAAHQRADHLDPRPVRRGTASLAAAPKRLGRLSGSLDRRIRARARFCRCPLRPKRGTTGRGRRSLPRRLREARRARARGRRTSGSGLGNDGVSPRVCPTASSPRRAPIRRRRPNRAFVWTTSL